MMLKVKFKGTYAALLLWLIFGDLNAQAQFQNTAVTHGFETLSSTHPLIKRCKAFHRKSLETFAVNDIRAKKDGFYIDSFENRTNSPIEHFKHFNYVRIAIKATFRSGERKKMYQYGKLLDNQQMQTVSTIGGNVEGYMVIHAKHNNGGIIDTKNNPVFRQISHIEGPVIENHGNKVTYYLHLQSKFFDKIEISGKRARYLEGSPSLWFSNTLAVDFLLNESGGAITFAQLKPIGDLRKIDP